MSAGETPEHATQTFPFTPTLANVMARSSVVHSVTTLTVAFAIAACGTGSLGAQDAPQLGVSNSGVFTGQVYDSTTARPLAAAELGLTRSDNLAQLLTTRADSTGRFRFDSLSPGTYLVGATHPRLDSLGIRQLTLLVNIRVGTEASATLSVPPIPRLIDSYCGPGTYSDSSGMMIGTVRQAIPDRRSVQATVRASWSELALTSRGFESRRPYRESATDATGHFIVCDTPSNGVISVRAWHDADSSGFVDLTVPQNGLLLRDLYVGPVVTQGELQARLEARLQAQEQTRQQAREVAPSNEPANTLAQHPLGAVRGTVRRPDGTALGDVRLSVSSSNTEVASSADGTFLLSALPTGTHTLEVRGVGLSPRRMPVDIVAGEVLTVALEMDRFIALDPVKVRADRLSRMRGLEGFNERRQGAWGYFLDPAEITQRNPVRLTDLLRRAPGVIVTPSSNVAGGDRIAMNGGCSPQFFVDGIRLDLNGNNIESLVFVNDIRAMEVYNRASITPPQFSTLGGCGAIVFWTGPRG